MRLKVAVLTGFLIILCASSARPYLAENIDPSDDDSQYAWAENVGWLNAEPLGNGGPGVQVDDFELTGWMWGENIGWVNLSCKNTSSCGDVDFYVRNDGTGSLSGYAWAENVGWINFAPSTAGVMIDVVTGDFSGRAWGENIGWITFASTGPNPFKVKTSWNCDPAPAIPTGSPTLMVDKAGTETLLSWTSLFGSTGYDIVKGDLGALRSSDGDFSQATETCLSNNHTSPSISHVQIPLPDECFWYIVRGVNCGGSGSYDSDGVGQLSSRDAEIDASGENCP